MGCAIQMGAKKLSSTLVDYALSEKVFRSPVWPSQLLSGLCAVAYLFGGVTALWFMSGPAPLPFVFNFRHRLVQYDV